MAISCPNSWCGSGAANLYQSEWYDVIYCENCGYECRTQLDAPRKQKKVEAAPLPPMTMPTKKKFVKDW